MNLPKEIGGYFELEMPKTGYTLPSKAILLNSGRSAFEYVLRSSAPQRVYIPKFTCDVLLQPLKRLGVEFEFYSINQKLELNSGIELGSEEMILYTNYFGLKHEYAMQLEEKYGDRLIYDCAQAFYAPPLSRSVTFYSPRKFFGLPDGGMLFGVSDQDWNLPTSSSITRMGHLLKRIESGPEAGFEEYKANDVSISYDEMSLMSPLTQHLLTSIDVDGARQIRNQNFATLHGALSSKNELSSIIGSPNGQLCYPYFATPELRQKLIAHRIFVPMYWPNMLEWANANEVEYQLTLNILPLPIDQRYGQMDMQRIIEVING